ncbi:CheR family methyltransferase [Deltaproteobacteria bacterium TL4]
MKSPLNDFEFKLITSLLEESCGMSFDRNRVFLLEQGLNQRMLTLKIKSFQEYYQTLIAPGRTRASELQELIELLTIGETYFFRNPDHFQAITDYILPQLLKSRTSLRVLSAACATGEEPYSLAMICKEYFPFAKIEIVATDINTESLKYAKIGLYSAKAIHKTEPHYLIKYFTKEKNHYRLHPDIIKSVIFLEGNLSDDRLYGSLGYFDLIICRNVLIYFTIPIIKKILAKFASVLQPWGFLILGHAETARGLSAQFEPIEKNNTFFYSLNPVEEQSPVSPPLLPQTPLLESHDEFKTTPEEVLPETVEDQAITLDADPEYERGLQYFILDKPEKSLEILEEVLQYQPDHQNTLLLSAILYAGKGAYERAHALCHQVLQQDEFSADAYYILGLIHEHNHEIEKAQKAYETTIFLNNRFALAYFKLAQFHLNAKRKNAAAKAFQNAAKNLKYQPEESFLIYSGGFTKAAITQVCEKNSYSTQN